MIAEKINTTEFFKTYNNVTTELLQLLSSTEEKKINTVPFKDSWTAAQVAEHIKKSNRSITQAMNLEGKATERNPEERTPELKKMFLNFEIKFKSPDFILPTESNYEKDKLITDLKKSIEHLEKVSNEVNLSESIKHPAFGEVTKLELLYFVLYHTQRHLHQIKNILSEIENK